jgi:hypothetical protein
MEIPFPWSLSFTNCTLSANTALGGAGGTGGDDISGSVSGGAGGTGGSGSCGAISAIGGLTLLSCTIVTNAAFGGVGGPGGAGAVPGAAGAPGTGSDGGICAYAWTCYGGHIGNTIVALNNAATHPNGYLGFTDDGYNFFGDNTLTICGLAPTTHAGTLLTPLDPQLGLLAQNGGGLPTHAPQVGSPVIGAGASFGLLTDERGAPRPTDGTADIGAVQTGSTALGMSVANNNVVLSWPAYYGEFSVQSTATLPGGDNWTLVPGTPVVVGDIFCVTNPISGPSGFYRLIRH